MGGFAVFDRTPPQADGPNNWSNDGSNGKRPAMRRLGSAVRPPASEDSLIPRSCRIRPITWRVTGDLTNYNLTSDLTSNLTSNLTHHLACGRRLDRRCFHQ